MSALVQEWVEVFSYPYLFRITSDWTAHWISPEGIPPTNTILFRHTRTIPPAKLRQNGLLFIRVYPYTSSIAFLSGKCAYLRVQALPCRSCRWVTRPGMDGPWVPTATRSPHPLKLVYSCTSMLCSAENFVHGTRYSTRPTCISTAGIRSPICFRSSWGMSSVRSDRQNILPDRTRINDSGLSCSRIVHCFR